MTQLTEQFHVPEDYHDLCDRLTMLVQCHTRRLLEDEYWTDAHLDALHDHSSQSYTYIRDDDYNAFQDVEEYVYSRFKRCVYQRVTHILDIHSGEYRAFQFVTETVEERKIRRIGWERLRIRLFEDEDLPYIGWGVLEEVVEKLNRYYDRHGRFPTNYTELVDCPDPNGTLPYAPDAGDYHIHDLQMEDGAVVVTLNAPDSTNPDSYHDWTEHTIQFPTHARFHEMLDDGDLGAPTLHASEYGYTVSVPVDILNRTINTTEDRVLAVDLGVKKQATCVPMEGKDGETCEQVAPPTFLDHPSKDKLLRVNADVESVNDRLAELRRQGKAHTDRFSHLLVEYRRTRRKERRLREQIQHDISNQLVWVAAEYGCDTVVFESLGRIDADDADGVTAWLISSWARGELLDHVRYKAGLLGIEVETVNPWGTSRYCPRCGERGETVNAPNDHTACRHGGHFHCRSCGYECDRDVVGAVNVGRKHLGECRMERANPAEYISTGKHASFPSHSECARSAADAGNESETTSVSGVQSTTDQQDVASGRQTRLSRYRAAPLTMKRGGTDTSGLHQNLGRNTEWRSSSGSVTRYVLASITECG